MARKIVKSALYDVGGVSSETLNTFTKVMTARQDEIDKLIQGYRNVAGHEGLETPLARILKDAAFVPASENRILNKSRSGKNPSFVVLSRLAVQDAAPEAGNLLSALGSFVSATSALSYTPHIIVGLTGEIVQLADLDHAVTALGKTVPPPAAMSYASREQELIDTVIGFTVANESRSAGGYAAFSNTADKYGVSYGFIQFNQLLGTLADLLKEMHRVDSAKFYEYFGDDLAPRLLDTSFVKDPETDLYPYKLAFQAAAGYPLFQQAQRTIAQRVYWAQTKDYANKLKIQSQRGYAVLFDAVVQRNPQFMRMALPKVKGTTERARLQEFANLADLYDSKGQPYDKPYTRRRDLFLTPLLSDVPLELSEPPAKSNEHVSDDTCVIIALEGRAGDPVTLRQRDALAKCLRVVNLSYGIPLSTERVFGLDRLPSVTTDANPGNSFNYLDLLSAARTEDVPAVGWYKAPQPLNVDLVSSSARALGLVISQNRSMQVLQRTAILQAYDGLKSLERANTYASLGRVQHTAAAVAQALVTKAVDAKASANAEKSVNTDPVPPIDPDTVVGLLYDFSTGKWNDGKAVGRYGDT